MQRFPVSIHPVIRDKPDGWRSEFSRGWERDELSLEEILGRIRDGRALIFAGMSSDHRTSAAYESSRLLAVDIDHGATLQAFLDSETELRRAACAFYTTSSHQRTTKSNPKGEDRFRILFQLKDPLTDGDTYVAAVRLLIAEMGGDAVCSDPCRIFYGNRQAIAEILDDQAYLSPDWIADAAERAAEERARMEASRDAIEDRDIRRAVWVLDNDIIPPTNDGDRELFKRVTAAAKSMGDQVFDAWQQWVLRGHHGRERRQSSQRFFDGFRGTTPGTLFHLADESSPGWRDQIPEELKPRSGPSGRNLISLPKVAGYDMDAFDGGGWDDEEEAEAGDGGLVTLAKNGPGKKKSQKQRSTTASGTTNEDLADDEGDEEKFDPGSAAYLEELAKLTFPLLRWSELQQHPEYQSSPGAWKELNRDEAYLLMSRTQGQDKAAPAKTQAYDAALRLARENPYAPARTYLLGLKRDEELEPSPFFDQIASRYLGAVEGPENPRMENGMLYADLVMRRFMVAAVDRAFNPGCEHQWLPILIGGQGIGKTRFLKAMTPELQDGAGYLWAVASGSITGLSQRPADLHQGWLVILDEFERYSNSMGAGPEKLKALIATNVDSSDRKYEQTAKYPRSFVLIGSANTTTFLKDPTGNRRFRPVICGSRPPGEGPIRVDLMIEERDALWKAAVQAFATGERHYFTGAEEVALQHVLRRFETEPVLASCICDLCRSGRVSSNGIDGEGRVTFEAIQFLQAMSIPVNLWQQVSSELEKAFEYLGFTKATGDYGQRVWKTPLDADQRRAITFDPARRQSWGNAPRGPAAGPGRQAAEESADGW